MPDDKLTKDQRREAARELARRERAKQKRRDSLFKWLVPTIVTVVILAVAGTITLVAINTAPPPQAEAGPRNMISDGILFTGQGGKMVPTETGAIPASGTPTPNPTGDPSIPHIVTYIDFSCPACQAFESSYADQLESMVAEGDATLEIHPIAILDSHYTTNYSTRANNVGACMADLDPNDFYAVMSAMYINQPTEGTAGLTNSAIIKLVHNAGVNNSDVDGCINGGVFEPWLTAATTRALSNESLIDAANGGFVTPTVLVNGVMWDHKTDFPTFIGEVQAGTYVPAS